MCGFAGLLQRHPASSSESLEGLAVAMAQPLRHRGPDDEGSWVDPAAGIAFGFRRLSIVDLSPAGHQPMHSASGRYVIVFNGEVYNFQELREELQASGKAPSDFRGHSDTEVMLAAFEAWGIQSAIGRFHGMFAFAVWDRSERVLTLCRDRFGEKPLYYAWIGNNFLFASELKALRRHPDFRDEIDRDALALFMRFNYVPAPLSIYRNVSKLQPAHFLRMKPDLEETCRSQPYWSLDHVVQSAAETPFRGSPEGAIEELDLRLRRIVKSRMLADVPLGAFLSGGIDSSLVVSLMQKQSSRPVRTFSIGFHEADYNESEDAKRIARQLGTEHTEFFVTPIEAIEVVPQLPEMYAEPFGDASQIPTHLIARLARSYVTVALTGDGGDELFGGYNRYVWYRRIWKLIAGTPMFLRRTAAHTMNGIATPFGEKIARVLAPLAPGYLDQRLAADKLQKIIGVLGMRSPESFYKQLTSSWSDPAKLVIGSVEPTTILDRPPEWPKVTDFVSQMMYLDTMTYLPDDILTKVDRATMAASLESRAPFLDHTLAEFAWSLPLEMKVRRGQGKWILRRLLERYVPREMFERPKMGFALPLGPWLCGPLRDWAESLLSEDRLRRDGYLNPQPVRQRWEEHISGKKNWHLQLWTVLMFQAWFQHRQPDMAPAATAMNLAV